MCWGLIQRVQSWVEILKIDSSWVSLDKKLKENARRENNEPVL